MAGRSGVLRVITGRSEFGKPTMSGDPFVVNDKKTNREERE